MEDALRRPLHPRALTAALLILCSLGCNGTSERPAAAVLDPDGLARLAAAARDEDRLTLYTTIAEKDLPTLVGPFEEK